MAPAFLNLICLLSLASPADLEVDIWLDQEDQTYYVGQKLQVYFQVNDGCFAAVYNVTDEGGVRRLFPESGADGRVAPDQTVVLPPPDADYDYVVSGGNTSERFVVLASPDHLPEFGESGPGIVEDMVELEITEPEPARLRIISDPGRCKIYITEVASGEKVYVGKAPRTIVLRPGEYIVKVKRHGYVSMERRIVLDPGEWRRVHVELREY